MHPAYLIFRVFCVPVPLQDHLEVSNQLYTPSAYVGVDRETHRAYLIFHVIFAFAPAGGD
jgi:hypothetical protein